MATQLKEFRFSWKDLNDALNKIVNAVNCNAPLEGTGIHLDEKGIAGTSINRADDTSGSGGTSTSKQQQSGGGGALPDQTPTGQTAGWRQINIVDQSCNQYTMYVWGGPPTLIL